MDEGVLDDTEAVELWGGPHDGLAQEAARTAPELIIWPPPSVGPRSSSPALRYVRTARHTPTNRVVFTYAGLAR